MVLNPHQEGPITGFGEREGDHIPIESDRYWGNTNNVLVKYLESWINIDILLAGRPDIFPAFGEAGIAEDDLIFQRFDTTHGSTSSSLFLSGIGL